MPLHMPRISPRRARKRRNNRGSGLTGHREGLYEPVTPGGDHHHHVVCDDCERIVPFEDPALERAIDALADRVPFAIAGHDVVLHGRCPDCQKR